MAQVIHAIETAGLNAATQPNYNYGLTQDQTGPGGGRGDPAQYIVQKLQLGAVHRITEGKDIVVALIDSRVDTKQPDIAGRIVDSYDAGCGPDAPPDAHGTGMAGAIASHTGLLGVAPNAKIMAICAFGGKGSPEATSTKIIRGVDYAIAHGAKIINMSFAGTARSGARARAADRPRKGHFDHRRRRQCGCEIAAALSGRRPERHGGHRHRRT